ncbi:hypothetical protein BLNAU_2485 [Blattamonas nauphoetae]|uniref:Uncharacterized protein n=1 Tax=Blattamonas nauphoetae TaxID=2049346 RepID=A0ABQ9YFV6_9EUKA|nr:hypothetical protein BLNAU_2485 [Blattamonas nauphoetae]
MPIDWSRPVKRLLQLGDCDLASRINEWKLEALQKMGKGKEQLPSIFSGINNDMDAAGTNPSRIFPIVPIQLLGTIWKDILWAIQQMHQSRTVQKNFNSTNFSIVDDGLKLTKFGLADDIPEEATHLLGEPNIGTV